MQRALAALVFAPALLGVVWLGGAWLTGACLVLAALMLSEFVQLTLGKGELYVKSIAFVAGAFVALGTLGLLPSSVVALATPLGVVLVLIALLLRPDPIAQAVTRAGTVLLGAAYAGGLITYLALLRALPFGLGAALSLMALFCTWGADTGAYFAGRALGRHKLYPKVSPGKTVEGALGGLLAAVAMAFLIRAALHLELASTHLVAIGVLVAVLGTLGDLAESMLKRAVGAKDSSHLIPGHGGVLDRFDAVMFVAPGLYAYATWVLVP